MKFSIAFLLLFAASTTSAQFRIAERAPNEPFASKAQGFPATDTTSTLLHSDGVLASRATEHAAPVAPEDSDDHRVVPSSRVYNVNPWVSSGITIAGAAVSLLALNTIRFKPEITNAEFDALRPDLINGFDRWALNVNTPDVAMFETYSNITQAACAVAPLSLLFMNRVKEDWGHVLLMYAEATSVTISLYVASPMGPQFQNKFRPSVYDETQTRDYRKDGNHRNSFYSGHVATASVGTFFFAKVYTDYHPELGAEKYWFFAAAAVPPLLMGYFRIKAHDHFPSDILTGLGVGALCGIMIPEIHRITGNNLSFGAYTAPGGSTGVTVQWMPGSSIAEK